MFQNGSSSVEMKCRIQAVFVLCLKIQTHPASSGAKFPFISHRESTHWLDLLILMYFEARQTKGMT